MKEAFESIFHLLKIMPAVPIWLFPFFIGSSANHFSRGRLWKGIGWIIPVLLELLLLVASLALPRDPYRLEAVSNKALSTYLLNVSVYFVITIFSGFAALVSRSGPATSEWGRVFGVTAVASGILLAAFAPGYIQLSNLGKERIAWQQTKEVELYEAGFVDYSSTKPIFGIGSDTNDYSIVSACFYTQDNEQTVFGFYSKHASKNDFQHILVENNIAKFPGLIYWKDNHLVAVFCHRSTFKDYWHSKTGQWQDMVTDGMGQFRFARKGECNWSVCAITAKTVFTDEEIAELINNSPIVKVNKFSPR